MHMQWVTWRPQVHQDNLYCIGHFVLGKLKHAAHICELHALEPSSLYIDSLKLGFTKTSVVKVSGGLGKLL